MKLSVIIPVYNAEKYLGACLDSLLRQTVGDWEAICVDDGSTDGSGAIAAAYAQRDPRIVVCRQDNGGAGTARNRALSLARGRWIGFVDSDDWISDDYFKALVDCAESADADVAATSGVVVVSGAGEVTKDVGIGVPGTAGTYDRVRMFLSSGTACNKIYRADFLRENGIRFPETCCAAEDNHFTLKALARCKKIVTTDAGRYHYRTVGGSLTHRGDRAHDERSAEIFRKLLTWVEENVAEDERRLWRGAIAVRAEGLPGFRMRVIASLTSYPPRIATVHRVIESLKDQSVLPDKIILWLSDEDFPSRELPAALAGLEDGRFEIRWVRGNLRSHKKYFHAFQAFPSDLVILFDDDICYSRTAVSELLCSFRRHADSVSARRVHLMRMTNEGDLAPYHEWDLECRLYVGMPMHSLCATTGHGTLFPPCSVPETVFDEERIRSLALSADDLWLKFATLALGVKTTLCSVDSGIGVPVDGETRTGLWRENVLGGGNDACIRRLVLEFGRGCTLARINGEQAELGRRSVCAMCWFRARKRLELVALAKKESLIDRIAERKAAGCRPVLLRMERVAIGGALCLLEHGVWYTLRRLVGKGRGKK